MTTRRFFNVARRFGATSAAAGVALVMVAAVALAAGGGGPETNPPTPPKTVTFPSHVGEVTFPHAMHVNELEIECSACHHPVTAPKLSTPHPQYFTQCSVPCETCHGASPGRPGEHRCSSCHTSAVDPAHDAIPSTKVALHQSCSACHEIGTGQDASNNCETCHSGPKNPW